MDKRIIIVGGFHEVIELCEELGHIIVGLIDSNLRGEYYNYPVIGKDSDAENLFVQYGDIPLVIAPDSPAVRANLFSLYSKIGFRFETIISRKAKISRSATIGIGSIIQDGVNVSANTAIGIFTKLNTGCNVMHDCRVGDFTTIAPNAVVLGKINIGQYSYIGANSTILPETIIENYVTVGAGAVVTKDIESNKTVKGVPAK